MSELKVKISCPLGHCCERAAGDTIERCAWFVKIEGKHPQTGEFMSERRCSLAWQPLLAIQAAGQTQQVAVSVQDLRNETVKRQDVALGLVKNAKVIADQ